MNVLIAVLGLAFLILVHEAGHFFTARAVGMRPRRFYVGFPPALVKTTRNGTEYGIGSIPLGGYVKIPGMHRPAPSDVEAQLGRVRVEAPELVGPVERLKRAIGGGDMQRGKEELAELSSAVERAELSPRTAEGARRGVQELADALGPEAYWRQRTWKRVAVIFAGPGTNLVFAIGLFAILFMVGGGAITNTVESVTSGKPAVRAGLKAGDEILAIDRRPVTPRDIPRSISASRGRPLTMTVARDGQRLLLGPMRARRDGDAYRLGFALEAEGLPFGASVWRSIELTGIVTREIGKALLRLVRGEGREEISSPVGIVQGSSTALQHGVETYMWVLGLISLSLALLNLLPLLPLDGGHIVFSMIEGLRGRAVGREIYERVSAVGIALVLLLFFVGLSNDVGRLSG